MNTLPSLSIDTIKASFSGNAIEETEFGVVTSTGSSGLNLVAMMKNDRIRNAISTNGVMSLSGACFFILTLGMFTFLRLRC
jgi:hypothetical protein